MKGGNQPPYTRIEAIFLLFVKFFWAKSPTPVSQGGADFAQLSITNSKYIAFSISSAFSSRRIACSVSFGMVGTFIV